MYIQLLWNSINKRFIIKQNRIRICISSSRICLNPKQIRLDENACVNSRETFSSDLLSPNAFSFFFYFFHAHPPFDYRRRFSHVFPAGYGRMCAREYSLVRAFDLLYDCIALVFLRSDEWQCCCRRSALTVSGNWVFLRYRKRIFNSSENKMVTGRVMVFSS